MHILYTCPSCKNTTDIIMSITSSDARPEHRICEICGSQMNRQWKTAIHIPEDFGDDLSTTISQKMRHAPRPTGKGKINY